MTEKPTIPESTRPFVTNKFFHATWAGTFYCHPQAIFQPRNVEEIKTLVNEARIRHKTIMTVGSGHSPSDLTMTKDWLCNLDKFNHVIKEQGVSGPVAPGSSEKEVKFVDLTVEAGCRIFELNEYLKQHNLAIQNLGSISEQSIAGLISTGTHGSTQYHGLVSQQVVSITFINSMGESITCSSIEKPNYFRAILLSLGKIGIITHVTLRTCPKYTIKSKQEIINFDTLLQHWSTVWLDSEFIRIWWFPYTGKCVLWRANKSTDPISPPRPSWYGTWSGRLFYQSLLWISVHLCPSLTPFIEKFVFEQQYGKVETLGSGDVAVQNSVEALNMDCLFSQFVNEWSAPLTKGVEILRQLQTTIAQAAKDKKFYVHAPIEVRCSNVTQSGKPFVDSNGKESLYPSQEWLSHRTKTSAGPIPGNNLRAYMDNSPRLKYQGEDAKPTNDQLTLFINATMYRPFGTNVDTSQWYDKFEHIMEAKGGKPHWAKNFIGEVSEKVDKEVTDRDLNLQLEFGGKKFYTMNGFKKNMQDWFGSDLVDFNKVRKETDPDGVFLSGRNWADRNGILLD
ncbi:ALO1 [Candida oxycetoniae]|uniref:D-arabinono-1,4-lactone oxidase n=1 Tax=Candida oxycetoniae TaxID=497107 RepID=A0AAI9T208_9ASCO|nr:ALO1 [Candida oxycetoniae]KAI3406886.2 ALO1 [Candida oxycetoniae]